MVRHKARVPFWQTWPALIIMMVVAGVAMFGLGLLNAVSTH